MSKGFMVTSGGGGAVTTQNLTVGNIKSGVTISVLQGNKTIQKVVGSYKPTSKRVVVGSYSGNRSIDVSSVISNAGLTVSSVNANNFSFSKIWAGSNSVTSEGGINSHTARVSAFTMAMSYSNGSLYISGANAPFGTQCGNINRPLSYTIVFDY